MISVSGIGNTVLQLPLIKNIIAQGDFVLDVLAGNMQIRMLLENLTGIRRLMVLPGTPAGRFRLVKGLALERYDYSIACFPSNRPEFHILPFVLGIKKRIIHSYPDSPSMWSILSNESMKAIPGIHDVEQNLNLLQCLGLRHDFGLERPIIELPDNVKQSASDFLKGRGLSYGQFLGLHPGSGPIRGKRWPSDYFAEVSANLLDKGLFDGALIFGGPEEYQIKRKVENLIGKGNVHVIDTPFQLTAALIAKCRFMVSNDSGLMHLAAALGTPVLGIFGPTDWKRTAPFGSRVFFERADMDCAPCFSYPFRTKKATIKCGSVPECLRSISPVQVISRVEEALSLC